MGLMDSIEEKSRDATNPPSQMLADSRAVLVPALDELYSSLRDPIAEAKGAYVSAFSVSLFGLDALDPRTSGAGIWNELIS